MPGPIKTLDEIRVGDPITAEWLNALLGAALYGGAQAGDDMIVNGSGVFSRSGIERRRLNFKNTTAEEIPAFAVMRMTGLTTAGEATIDGVAKPNTYGSQYSHFINGPLEIAAGKNGYCHNPAEYTRFGMPFKVLYDTDSGGWTPAAGDICGPRTDSWKVHRRTGGFMVWGDLDSEAGTVRVVRVPFLNFRGKTNAAIASLALGTGSIYYQSALGTYTDTAVDTPTNSLFNGLSAEVASGAWIEAVYAPFGSTEGWRITQADCS